VSRRWDLDDLVGAAEIATRLGLKTPMTIHQWSHRHADFPRPIMNLTMGQLWSWRAVNAWARKTGRSTG
jgi:hypothetical protein